MARYLFGNSYEWLEQSLKNRTPQELRNMVLELAQEAGLDKIQDLYQSEMDEDGYFDPIITVSQTFETWSDADRLKGDTNDRGYVFENQEMRLSEVKTLIEEGGFSVWSSSEPKLGCWISTVDPERDFASGEDTFCSLHFSDLDEEQFQELVLVTNQIK